MGTFGSYTGSEKISAEKKDEFARAVSSLLFFGGMMHLRNVELYGKKITLLDPVNFKPGEDVDFYFNYFEDDSWENAGYRYEKDHFYSQKIGSLEFNDVITAVHVLYEHYDEDMGFAEVNGEIVPSDYITGWINNILDKKFSINRRLRVWESAEACVKWRSEYYDDPIDMNQLWDIIPEDYRTVAGGTELSDVLYIIYGTDTLTDDEVIPGTYPYDVLMCKKTIINLIEKEGKEEAYNSLIGLLKMSSAKRKKEKKEIMKFLADASIYMPARVFLYLISEQLKKSFWTEWIRLKDEVYKDEHPKKYASDDLIKLRNERINAPVEKIGTSEYLKQVGWFVFHGTPEELRYEPKYYLSDIDRLYWWDGSDEVVIGEEAEEWLNSIKKNYEELLKKESGDYDTQEFVKKIIELLVAVDERYGRVHAFNDMFYEFITNGNEKEYHAAINLLEKLYKDNAETGKIIKKAKNWGLTSKQVKCNRGRMRIKRYLSLLANKRLRRKYLGF